MPTTRSQACSVQPTEQVTSPRADPPRRVLRSRQGNAGVVIGDDGDGGGWLDMNQFVIGDRL